MEFGLSKEQMLLQESVGRYLDRDASLERVQAVRRRQRKTRRRRVGRIVRLGRCPECSSRKNTAASG